VRRASFAPAFNVTPELTARARAAVPGGYALVTIALTAALGGGFFPETWGWVALGGLVVVAAALLTAERAEGGLRDVAFVGGLVALVLWTALSASWSDSVPRSVSEVERDLVYVAAAAAVLAVARRRFLVLLLAGLLAGTGGVCVYALATKLLPDVFGYGAPADYRLSRPLGYWNAVGLLASIAVLLALGFAASARRRLVRAPAAGLVPLLVATLYLTFGRGAWFALGVGLVVALATSPERLRFAVHAFALGALSGAGVWLASRSAALATPGAPHEQVAHDGRVLAAALAGIALASAAAAPALERVPATIASPALRRVVALAAAVVIVTVVAAVVVRAGGPADVLRRGYHSFTASNGALLTRDRVFVFSSAGRTEYWHVAAKEYGQHAWLGSGAGTFDLYWHRYRPNDFGALDAHSLYVETLAELGPLGLLLLAAALAAPLTALTAARRAPIVAAVGGAYVAFLVHAAIDWDWELPTVTLAGLFCGAALVVAARSAGAERWPPGRGRTAVLGAVGVLATFAIVSQAGNSALRDSQQALERRDYPQAEERARAAERWAPWSSEARLALAAAESAQGDVAASVKTFEAAVRRDPRDWQTWFQLAVATRGRMSERALSRAARLNPRAPEVAALRASRR
jgi:tetratricopeptide (TPR) repeat protein